MEKEIQALSSEMEQCQSDVMRALEGIRLNLSDSLSLQEDERRRVEEMKTIAGRMKSANVAIAASLAQIQRKVEASPSEMHFPSRNEA